MPLKSVDMLSMQINAVRIHLAMSQSYPHRNFDSGPHDVKQKKNGYDMSMDVVMILLLRY